MSHVQYRQITSARVTSGWCWRIGMSQMNASCYSLSHLGWHFRMLFQSSKLTARTSLLPRCSEKRRSSCELWALKELSENVSAGRISCTGWRRPIGCLKLQVIFRKRATNYRALWQKMTYEDKASYDSTPPCTYNARLLSHMNASCHIWMSHVRYEQITTERDVLTRLSRLGNKLLYMQVKIKYIYICIYIYIYIYKYEYMYE